MSNMRDGLGLRDFRGTKKKLIYPIFGINIKIISF